MDKHEFDFYVDDRLVHKLMSYNNIEEYRLTLTHSYIDEVGKRYPVEEPITCAVTVCDTDRCYNVHIVNEIIDRLCSELRNHMLNPYRDDY